MSFALPVEFHELIHSQGFCARCHWWSRLRSENPRIRNQLLCGFCQTRGLLLFALEKQPYGWREEAVRQTAEARFLACALQFAESVGATRTLDRNQWRQHRASRSSGSQAQGPLGDVAEPAGPHD